MTNTRMTDPEVLELRYPVRLEEFAIRTRLGRRRAAGAAATGRVRRIRFLEPMTAVDRRLPPQRAALRPRRRRGWGAAGGNGWIAPTDTAPCSPASIGRRWGRATS